MVFAVVMTILSGAGGLGQPQGGGGGVDGKEGLPFVIVPVLAPGETTMQAGRFEAISSSTYTVTIGQDEVTMQRRVAVGWYDDGSDILPMLFDSALANSETADVMAFTELPLPTNAVGGEALGVSDGIFDGEEHPLVVGYAWNSNGDEEAVWWDWDSTQEEWVCSFLFGSSFSGNDSRAVGVELDPDSTTYERMHIFGQKEQTSGATPNVFKVELDSDRSPIITRTANGTYDVGMNTYTYSSAWAGDDNYPGGNVTVHNGDGVGTLTDATSGDDLAFIWRGLSLGGIDSLHPSGSQYLESGANDIANWDGTGTPPAVGWVLEDASPSAWKRPIYWRNASQTVYFYLMPGFITDAEAIAVNGEDEILVRGDSGGIALWKWVTVSSNLEGDAFNLDEDRVQMTPSTLGSTIADATDINDEGWITATYIPDGETAQLPCILVPYDMNNNGEPDFREIMEASIAETTDLDVNDNWILDQAEQMRVGLHAPGEASDDEGSLDPVQIVRLRTNIKPSSVEPPEGLGSEDWIDIIVDTATSCTACINFTNKVNGWATGSDRTGNGEDEQSEIVIRVHSMMGPSDFGDQEALPANTTAEAEALRNVRVFAHRFARCIDYLQWGNESFGGSGQYAFRSTDLTCETIANGTLYRDLSLACKQEAIGKILEWQAMQLEAALIGSALAGRPLRMASTGIFESTVREGHDAQSESNESRYTVTEVAEWCNAYGAHFGLHVHYAKVVDALTAIAYLVDDAGAPWDVPKYRLATEVGAKADFLGDDWWAEVEPEFDPHSKFVIHNQFFFGTVDPEEKWEEFIERWEGFSDNFDDVAEPGFRVDDVMAAFDDAGFTGICWTALQYDVGSEIKPSQFLVEGIRATKLRHGGLTNDPDRFTPIADAYLTAVNAAPGFKILNFAPHPEPCDTKMTCPGCN